MQGSNSLEESDTQPTELCPVCLHKVQRATGCNLEKRYEQLLQYYIKNNLAFEQESIWVKDILLFYKNLTQLPTNEIIIEEVVENKINNVPHFPPTLVRVIFKMNNQNPQKVIMIPSLSMKK